MKQVVTEVEHLRALLDSLESRETKNSALVEIANIYGSIIEEGDASRAYVALFSSLDQIEQIANEHFIGGQKSVAENAINELRRLFGLEASRHPYNDYIGVRRTHIATVRLVFPILTDLSFDLISLQAKLPDAISEIQRFKDRISLHDDVSDQLKTVLFAQIDLMEKSLVRVQERGIGEFRHSVFTTFGRIYLELRANSEVSDKTSKEIVDDFLRIYQVFEAGGSLLQLGAPVIRGLIGAPG